ncbi:RBR-type E3 ubiquitin transferase, partial [Haematococcus lacustris]
MCESSAEYDFSGFDSGALLEIDAKIKVDEEKKVSVDDPSEAASSRRPLYKILNKQDLQLRRDDAIREVTSVLGISDDDASRVLRKFQWDVNRVHDPWFSDMDAVKASVGLQDPGPSTTADHATCMVCFDTFPLPEMRSAACRHHYCTACWRGYVNNAIANGPASLDLRCPTPKCKAC